MKKLITAVLAVAPRKSTVTMTLGHPPCACWPLGVGG